MLITAKTPDELVVRDVFAHRERAWRLSHDHGLAKSAGHKGPWIACGPADVPAEVQALFQPCAELPTGCEARAYALARTYLLFQEAAEACPIGPLVAVCENLADALRSLGYLPSEAERIVAETESQGT